jgi:hypothetical protein
MNMNECGMFLVSSKKRGSANTLYWPERLLHISTFTSHQRYGRNTYGTANTVSKPLYATLSYTWGRFVEPGGSSLPVGGTTWTPPSVDTSYFTVPQLQMVLLNISLLTGFEYIWLDIACVNTDQMRSNPEIGRQREIFSQATTGFVWLCKTYGSRLCDLIQSLYVCCVRVQQKKSEDILYISDVC